MNKRLEQIVSKHSPFFDNWIKTINDYIRDSNTGTEASREEVIDQVRSVVRIFSELAESCISYGNFKDSFEYEKFYQHYYGPELIINSEKTGTTYYLGLDDKGIYMRTYMKHAFNLKNMDDGFWVSLLSLHRFGKFELVENEHFGRKTRQEYPELFGNQKGAAYRIFRKYFVGFLTGEGRTREDSIGDLGNLQVTWGSDFGIDAIVSECCEVFKILYKINYELWKVDDVKSKLKRK